MAASMFCDQPVGLRLGLGREMALDVGPGRLLAHRIGDERAPRFHTGWFCGVPFSAVPRRRNGRRRTGRGQEGRKVLERVQRQPNP